MTGDFERTYLRLTRWIRDQGFIEIGADGFSRSFLRVLDEGGLVWEGGDWAGTIDDALRAAEAAVERWERGELEPA